MKSLEDCELSAQELLLASKNLTIRSEELLRYQTVAESAIIDRCVVKLVRSAEASTGIAFARVVRQVMPDRSIERSTSHLTRTRYGHSFFGDAEHAGGEGVSEVVLSSYQQYSSQ